MSERVVYKPAGIAETFTINWRHLIVSAWRPDTDYPSGSIVRPPIGNGYYYEATQANREISNSLVPDFPPSPGETIQDGSVVWTCRDPSSPTLEAISSSTWALDSGLTEDASSTDGLRTLVTISGGVAGEQYRVVNTIVRSTGEEEEDSFILEILDPPDV